MLSERKLFGNLKKDGIVKYWNDGIMIGKDRPMEKSE
jgi:hypothetical protein